MHYLGAPFALLATTFVTAVSATPINVHVRQNNAGDLFSSVFAVNQLTQIAENDLQKISVNSTVDPSLIATFLEDFSAASGRMSQLGPTLLALGSFNDADSNQLMIHDVLPLYNVLNSTAFELVDKSYIGLDINSTALNNLIDSVEDMTSGIDSVTAAVKHIFTSDVASQLDTISLAAESSFNETLRVLQNDAKHLSGLGGLD